MSQQTFTPGGAQVAEPPAPVLPEGESVPSGDDNRRKLMVVGAAVGVLVLAIVAFFLLKGGGSSSTSESAWTPPHKTHTTTPVAAKPPVVKLPKHVAAPVGRDPFKVLYTAPVAAAAGSTSTTGGTTTTTTTGGTTTTTSGGSTTPTTTTTPTYHPVWVQLKSVTATAATFDVGLSNGKTLKAVRYSGIKPLHTFRTFELLSIHNGVVTVKYGDGTPFQLDKSHNTMVVD
jgi:hypothetical protein